MLYENERKNIVRIARSMMNSGLVVNTSGNVSSRIDGHVLITPNARDYESLTPGDIVVLDMNGEVICGDLLPSSELPLHLEVYASNSDSKAIVHTHSLYATVISSLFDELPAIHYQIAGLGGPVPVAPYRTFGSSELAKEVAHAIQGRSAVLMKNHGAVTIANDVTMALKRSITLEWLSQVYLLAISCGVPTLLDNDELIRVGQKQAELSRKHASHLLRLSSKSPVIDNSKPRS